MLLSQVISIQGQDVKVVSGKYTSDKQPAQLKTFMVSKGDIIDINLTTLHKKRGLNIWVKQHPGNLIVFDFEELTSSTKQLIAPADAIYQVFYGGTKLDFEVEIINHTTKPSGSGRGEMVYVRIPDTLHTSGYVNRSIGENYTITPYKEKVKLGTIIQSETVASRDFITGQDFLNVYIPGDEKDEYREQKLLSYSISLTVDAPSCYDAMMGVVDAGMDAFIPDITPDLLAKRSKVKKMNPTNSYEVVKDMGKEKEKWEKTIKTIEIAQELGDSLAPNKNNDADKILATTGFLLDTDGMKKMALEKGLKTVGAPEEIFTIMAAVENIPSATDFLKKGVHKYASKIKGTAHLQVFENKKFAENIYTMPPATKEYWIQSAMNYGQNPGGCWDVPGSPTAGANGQNIVCWDIDQGTDRKFKFVPSSKFPGYYEIHSALAGYALDNWGGNGNLKNNGNNILLWKRHGDKSQVFRFAHSANGKFKIYNYDGFVVHLIGCKNGNGNNIAIWDDHNGPWMEWYLVDPLTTKAFVPQIERMANGQPKTVDVWKEVAVINKENGTINETVFVASENEPVNPDMEDKEVKIKIWEKNYVSDAKLIVEAKYMITDYTEIIKHKRITQPVNTKDFWTAYKVDYDYQIMFKDQVKDYYQIVPKGEYYSSQRPSSEELKSDDYEQKTRLMRYKLLTQQK